MPSYKRNKSSVKTELYLRVVRKAILGGFVCFRYIVVLLPHPPLPEDFVCLIHN